MNRRSLIALASIVGLTVWHKPIINSIVLPAHAQTSCMNILDVDVIGKWLFTDAVGNTVEVEFIDSTKLIFGNRTFSNDWRYSTVNDPTIIMEIRNPRAPWVAAVSQETGCVASEITIISAPTDASTYTAPLIGVRT